MIEKARISSESRERLGKLLAARVRFERRTLNRFDHRLMWFERDLRQAIEYAELPAGMWTMIAHARAFPALRSICRAFGATITRDVSDAAQEASRLGVAQSAKAWRILSGSTEAAPFDVTMAEFEALNEVNARTESIGARVGETLGQIAVGASYLEAIRGDLPAAVVASKVVDAVIKRARNEIARIVATELTAAFAAGIAAAARLVAVAFPALRKIWDSTLDNARCERCGDLHRKHVPYNEPFALNVMTAPAHPNCRCAVWPWLAAWTV